MFHLKLYMMLFNLKIAFTNIANNYISKKVNFNIVVYYFFAIEYTKLVCINTFPVS